MPGTNPLGDPYWEAKHLWYKGCTEQSCKYDMGSFEYCFWWSLRDELSKDSVIKQWAEDPEQAITDWTKYFLFKWEQLRSHRDPIRVAAKRAAEAKRARKRRKRRAEVMVLEPQQIATGEWRNKP